MFIVYSFGLHGSFNYSIQFTNQILKVFSVSITIIISKRSKPQYKLYSLFSEILTRVWTKYILFALICVKNSCTLTVSSTFNLSIILSSIMKVPVLPTPALQWTSNGTPLFLLWSFCTRLIKFMREVANCGTPWSGQLVKWYWVTARTSSLP